MRRKRIKTIIILSAVLLVLLVVLIFLIVNVQDKKFQIKEEILESEEINIVDLTAADYYNRLFNVYITNSNNEHSVILIPNNFEQYELSFNNGFNDNNFTWNVKLSTDADIDECFATLNDYMSGRDDVELLADANNGSNRYQILSYADSVIECHYFLVMNNDIRMYMIFSFNPNDLNEESNITLSQLKEVYQIDLLELPDLDILVEENLTSEEMDEIYGE